MNQIHSSYAGLVFVTRLSSNSIHHIVLAYGDYSHVILSTLIHKIIMYVQLKNVYIRILNKLELNCTVLNVYICKAKRNRKQIWRIDENYD